MYCNRLCFQTSLHKITFLEETHHTSHIFVKLLPLVDYFCSIPTLYEGQNNYACVSDTDSILSYLILFRPVLSIFL